MAIREVTINNFSQGIKPTQRGDVGTAAFISNFDNSQDPKKLVPRTTYETWLTEQEKNYGILGLGVDLSDNVLGLGKAISNWYHPNNTYRTTLSVAKEEYNNKTVDYNYIDLKYMPDDFWSQVDSDGGDIVITDSNHDLVVSRVAKIDTTNKTGSVIFGGQTGDYYIYWGGASNTESYANLTYQTELLYPLDNTIEEVTSLSDTENLDESASYSEAVRGKIGKAYGGAELRSANFQLSGNEKTVSFLYYYGTTPSTKSDVVETQDVTVRIDTDDTIEFFVQGSGGNTTSSSYGTLKKDEWNYITCVAGDDEVYIYINGTLSYGNSNAGHSDVDANNQPIKVNIATDGDSIEFVSIDNSAYSENRAKTQANMHLNEFWNIGGVEVYDGVAPEYDGVCIYSKGLSDDAWLPVMNTQNKVLRSLDYAPIGSDIVENNNIYRAVVSDNTSFFDGTDIHYITELGQTTLTWNKETLQSLTLYPRFEQMVDKKYNTFDASNIHTFSSTITGDAFSAFTTIVDVSRFGQYSAIASRFQDASQVQLWDLTSTTNSAFIDFGFGEIQCIHYFSGVLWGVVNRYLEDDDKANGTQSMDILIFQGGDSANTFLTFESPLSLESLTYGSYESPVLNKTQSIKNGFLFFAEIYDADENLRQGFFSITKNEQNNLYSLSQYLDTSDLDRIIAFTTVGNNLVFVDKNNKVYKTSSSSYGDSVWQSTWFGGSGIEKEDQLENIEVLFEPLASGQTITCEVRTQDQDWQTLFTHTETGSKRRQGSLIEATESQLPKFQEMQVRVTSNGGSSAITGIKVRYQELTSE